MTFSISRTPLAILLCGLLAALVQADDKKPRVDLSGDALPEGALARLGSTRLRHGDPVSFVAFLPDRKTLVSAGCDLVVRIWDISSGKELRRFAHYQDEDVKGFRQARRTFPLLAGLSPDGKTLVTCVLNNSDVRLWDVASGKELKRIALSIPVNAVSLAPDGKSIAASCSDGSARLFDLDGKELRSLGVDPMGNSRFFGGVSNLTFSPSSKTLVVSGLELDNGTLTRSVRAWDVANGKLLYRIEPDGQANLSSAGPVFSPDGKTLAAGSIQSGIVLYDAATGKELRTIKPSIPRVDNVLFSADGKTLIGRSMTTGTVGVWDVASGKESKIIGTPAAMKQEARGRLLSQNGTSGLALSHDGKLLAAADGNMIRLLDLRTGKEIISSNGHRGPLTGLTYRADGKTLVSQATDATIRLWDPANGKQTGEIQVPEDAYLFTLSPNGKTLVIAATDGTVRLMDVSSGKERHRLQEAAGARLSTYVFSADGKTLAVRSRLEPVAQVYAVETGKLLAKLGKATPMVGRRGRFYARASVLALSPDGKTLAMSAIEGGATLWDVSSGQALALVFEGIQVREAAFSPDGRTLALDLGNSNVFVYEMASGTERRTYTYSGVDAQLVGVRRAGFGPFNSMVSRNLAFSPDGRRVALAGEDRTIHVWNLLTGEQIGRLTGHQGEVSVLAFSPDSKTLASAGEDATGLIWDMTALKSERKPPAKLADAALETLWADLQSAIGREAFTAIGSLVAVPAQAVAFLDPRLKAPEPVAEAQMEKLIADLDSRRFPTRKKALEELERLGSLALPALTRALAGKTSEEKKKRILELVEKIRGQTLTPVQLQIVRAVEVLERAGTAEAKAVLQRLAKGPGGALETEQARAALLRLR